MVGSVKRNGSKRVILKLGSEVFGGGKVGVDSGAVQNVARQITEASREGVEICVVISGGNFFHGARLQQHDMDRARSDYMGMLGTVMNCLVLQDFLEQEDVGYHVRTVISMAQISGPYLPLHAKRRLEKGRVVIFGTGMGMPYFSTDTTAAQRTLEIGCKVLLMVKAVDSVYSADPREVPDTGLFDDITHHEVLEWGLRVADVAALSLCMDNNMPILVFDLLTDGNIARAVVGKQVDAFVHS